MKALYVNLSKTVEPGYRYEKSENYIESPFDGYVNEFIIWIPSGTDNLVEVACGVNNERLAPQNGVINFVEGVMYLKVNCKVNKGDMIWAEIANRSSTETYRVVVLARVEENAS